MSGTLALDLLVGSLLHAAGVLLPAMPRNLAFRTAHPVYHHGLRPGVALEETWGDARHGFHTNDLAMRDASVRQVPLAVNSRRILLIGDSFTEGVGVAHRDSYAGLLASALARDGVEVLNAGVSSYSPIIYLRKVQHLIEVVGLQFDHLSVAIDMSDIYDETTYWFDAERRVRHKHEVSAMAKLKRFFAEHTVLVGSLRMWLRVLKDPSKAAGAPPGLHRKHSLWASEDAPWSAFGRRGMERAIQHLSELHDYLRDRGIGLNIVIYPWPDQVARGELQSRQVVEWGRWARRRKVALVDLHADFIGPLPAAEALARYFIPGDVHWNEAGHRIVAARLEAFFRLPGSRSRPGRSKAP